MATGDIDPGTVLMHDSSSVKKTFLVGYDYWYDMAVEIMDLADGSK